MDSMKRKVFGIGLNKTGTSTLAVCLESFGYRHLGCQRHLLVALREGRLDEVFAATDAHDSFEDWPYPMMYQSLFQRYPDALFILTTRRSPDVWLKSLKTHSLYTKPSEQCRRLAYGFDYPHGFESEHVAFYEKHNTEVESFFKSNRASDRLLKVCWENGDGWEKLCAFLDAPIPNIPFPHANQKQTKITPLYLRNVLRSSVYKVLAG